MAARILCKLHADDRQIVKRSHYIDSVEMKQGCTNLIGDVGVRSERFLAKTQAVVLAEGRKQKLFALVNYKTLRACEEKQKRLVRHSSSRREHMARLPTICISAFPKNHGIKSFQSARVGKK